MKLLDNYNKTPSSEMLTCMLNQLCAGVWCREEDDHNVSAHCEWNGVSCWAEVCPSWSCS